MLLKNKRLLAALCATLGAGQAAPAALVHFSGQDIPIPTTFAGVSVNLETGATTNNLEGAPGMHVNFFLGGERMSNDADQSAAAPIFEPVRTGTGNTDPLANQPFGTTVNVGSVFANPPGFGGSASHFPDFVNGVEGYIGFSMEIAGPTTVYGWMRVTLQNDNTPGVIHEWAYDDAGAPVTVGVIPEPSHALLTVLGLSTLALRRQRRG